MSAQTRRAPAELRHLRLLEPVEQPVAGWRVAVRGVLTSLVLGAVILLAALLVESQR